MVKQVYESRPLANEDLDLFDVKLELDQPWYKRQLSFYSLEEKSQTTETIPLRTMKYLSLITATILLVTLFSFAYSQLNKDETKHEYGLAFPLEESESRLPPLNSVLQANPQPAGQNVESLNEATTTTETIATSTSANRSPIDDEPKVDDGKEMVTIESVLASGNDSNVELDSSKEEVEDGVSLDSVPSANPKMFFIERLMGMNIQRSPQANNGFASFLEVHDTSVSDEEKNRTEPTPEEETQQPPKETETAWGGTLENLRSKWESRIRKFTFPFQNTYSVVLRASNVVEPSGPEVAESESVESEKKDEQQPTVVAPVEKYYVQPSGIQSATQSNLNTAQQQQQQSNQLLRLAALSMMSKLFSAIRSQMYSNSKLDSPKIAELENHELDLDDDDDGEDGDERNPETISVPIIIGAKPKSFDPSMTSGPYGDELPQPNMRTTIMYGRPSMSVASQQQQQSPRFYPQSPLTPLSALLAAAAARNRRFEPQPQEPQRLILLITQQREAAQPQQPRIQLVAREEQPTYQPSQSSPNVMHYLPQPVMYHQPQPQPHPLSSLLASMATSAQPQQQPVVRPQVVEVPVPVYVPMMRFQSWRNAVSKPSKPLVTSRLMGKRIPQPQQPSPQPQQTPSSGHVAIVYVNHPEPEPSVRSLEQQQPQYAPPTVPSSSPVVAQEQPIESEPSGIVRILLRPKNVIQTPPEAPPAFARFAYHRRIDEPEEVEPMFSPSMLNVMQHDGRMRQWRDYSQQQQQQQQPQSPQPMAHVLIAASAIRGSEEQEVVSPSDDHYHHHQQQQQPQHYHSMAPIYYSASPEAETAHLVMPSIQQPSGGGGGGDGGATTFLVLADPSTVHQQDSSDA